MERKLQTKGEERRLTVPLGSQTATVEVSEEHTLPDYYPEVRRVVSVLGRVLPEGVFVRGDSAEESGTVSLTVLYVGEDGTLAAVPLSADFKAVASIPEWESGGILLADTVSEGMTCRATGPRRLSLRARLRTVFRCFGDRDTTPTVTAEGDGVSAAALISVRTLEQTQDSLVMGRGAVTDSVTGQLCTDVGLHPILCDGEVNITDSTLSEGTVTVRGEALVWCICYSEEGAYLRREAKAAFEKKVPLEGGAPQTGTARAVGRAASVTVKEGEGEGLSFELEYDLVCEGAAVREAELVKDAYSTDTDSAVKTASAVTVSPLKCGIFHLSVSDTVKKEISDGKDILAVYGGAVAERVTHSEDRLTLSGTAEVHFITCGEGDATENTLKLPFRYECDCTGSTSEEELCFRCGCTLWEPSVKLDADSLRASAEVYLSLCVLRRSSVDFAGEISLARGERERSEEGQLVMYFPSVGEGEFDIAKKYRIPTGEAEPTGDGVLIEP